MIFTFKEFLQETQLNAAELFKVASSGQNKGDERTAILKKAIENGDELELADGSTIVLDKSSSEVKQLLSLLSDNKMIGDEVDALKDFLSKGKPFISTDGQSYKLSDIKKSSIFGGGGKGSGGGAADTEKTESLQCVALAVAVNQSGDISESDLTADNIKEVESKFDISLYYKDTSELEDLLHSDDKWLTTYIETANAVKKHFKLNDSYVFHRGSKWTKDLYDTAKGLNKTDEGPFKNMNKWNPADVWIVKGDIELPKSVSLIDLNGWLADQFSSKKVIGVSLKKTSSATLKVMNLDETLEDLANIDIIQFVISSKNNIFAGKDAYINFDEDRMQVRSFQTGITSIQGEIQGTQAAHGKIGLGNIQHILKKLNLGAVIEISAIKNLIHSSAKNKAERYDAILDLLIEYIKTVESDISPEQIRTQFLNSPNTDSDGWVASKLQATQLVSILKKTTETKRKNFILHSIAFAASRSELSSVYIKVS